MKEKYLKLNTSNSLSTYVKSIYLYLTKHYKQKIQQLTFSCSSTDLEFPCTGEKRKQISTFFRIDIELNHEFCPEMRYLIE